RPQGGGRGLLLPRHGDRGQVQRMESGRRGSPEEGRQGQAARQAATEARPHAEGGDDLRIRTGQLLRRAQVIQSRGVRYHERAPEESHPVPRHLRLVLILVLLSVLGCARGISVSFEIPKEEIQKKIESKFPVETTQKQGDSPLSLTLSNPVVILEEGKDQIGLRVNLTAETAAPSKPPDGPSPPPPAPPKSRFTGSATFFGSVSYDPKKKAISISNPKVTELKIDQLPKELSEPLSRLAEQALAQKFSEQSFPLEGQGIENAITSHLKSVAVKDGKIVIEIGWGASGHARGGDGGSSSSTGSRSSCGCCGRAVPARHRTPQFTNK